MPTPAHIILPGTEGSLLRRELALAFAAAGCRVSLASPEELHDPASPRRLPELLTGERTLLFSVNFQGLGRLRDTLETLGRANAIAAVWCVDNPWNLLSGVRDPRWKTLPLFVTDASFIKPLTAHGATLVRHLPLAASPALFLPDPARDTAFPPPQGLAPFVFVGRSSFPGKDRFFAGETLPDAAWRRAGGMLSSGRRPDLLWWEKELGAVSDCFWPGKKARRPAYCAEEANLLWRNACLTAAALAGRGANGSGEARHAETTPGLDIFGDRGWGPLLPAHARLSPPVDYYARLPGIYATARYSLCLTSLQLPEGLNQRHFDIWMAGGVCLSDATPGLALFPDELTRPITFARPADIGATAERIERSGDRAALTAAWQRRLLEFHTYAHRACAVLEAV